MMGSRQPNPEKLYDAVERALQDPEARAHWDECQKSYYKCPSFTEGKDRAYLLLRSFKPLSVELGDSDIQDFIRENKVFDGDDPSELNSRLLELEEHIVGRKRGKGCKECGFSLGVYRRGRILDKLPPVTSYQLQPDDPISREEPLPLSLILNLDRGEGVTLASEEEAKLPVINIGMTFSQVQDLPIMQFRLHNQLRPYAAVVKDRDILAYCGEKNGFQSLVQGGYFPLDLINDLNQGNLQIVFSRDRISPKKLDSFRFHKL